MKGVGAAKVVRTWKWRSVATATAALGMLLPAATAEGATYWTIKPDVRDPLLWVGLGPPTTDPLGQATATAVLAVPTANARDQHWRIYRSGVGYKIANRQSGQCLYGLPDRGPVSAPTMVLPCQSRLFGTGRYSNRFNFHVPGRGQIIRVLSPGTYLLRYAVRRGEDELFGRCLSVPVFQVGVRPELRPCTRGTKNQKFVLKSFTD